jgi:hypothetical protein
MELTSLEQDEPIGSRFPKSSLERVAKGQQSQGIEQSKDSTDCKRDQRDVQGDFLIH